MGTAPDTDRREGRGRLSSIDMLPEEAEPDIIWANQTLRERSMPQTEILRELNARLADRGIGPISKGAFSRYSVRASLELRRMAASRQLTELILSKVQPGERSEGMVVAIEMMKHRIIEMVMAEDEPSPGMLNKATLALQRLSSVAVREAQVKRIERKDEQEAAEREAVEQKAAADAETAETVSRIATEAGLSADAITAIRKGVLGLSA
jgi:hypothetical protein